MRVVSGLLFFPRGGSAQVERSLSLELARRGWDVTLVSGSLSDGGYADAGAFFAGLDVRPVDFVRGDAPMQPSFEDRPGAPDRCFARLGDEECEEHVEAWSDALDRADAASADVLHLHHLTPLNEAASRVAPDVPVVAHLHGTELAMLERIDDGPPVGWDHAEAWARRMRRWARGCVRLIVHTRAEVERTADLLGVDPDACTVVPNGFDPARFRPGLVDRGALWRRHLVQAPRGWAPGGPVGSVRYADEEVARLDDAVVFVAVGRYTAVKRLGLLIRAFERARARARRPAALVVVGGHPGEYEGEHPLDAIRAARARDVFLAGWHEHEQLPALLNAADVQVLASVREQFGLVLVEGMACGLPAIAVDRFGPAEIVDDGRTGWLVPPDDEQALADAILAVVDDPEERSRRGIAARADALRRWSWPSIATRVAEVLGDAAIGSPGARRSPAQPG
ncbi:MAG TPA: glycosyltransferase family 4 protein [Solirubrobacteraceae bacterium]|nr:glycosyltransferase family 4 protein [Solirubrobacteraceae bacterium]